MGPQHTSPEQSQLPQVYVERPTGVELGIGATEVERQAVERVEQRPGVAEASAQVSNAMPATTLPVPVASDDTTSAVPVDDNPAVAGDEDLIEKEWVDRAKQIIAHTKDDPYKREQAIKALKIDYVKKRYGKTIGMIND